jgi:hypothetical protein
MFHRIRHSAALALGLALLSPLPSLAQQAPTTKRVQFKPGASSATISGTIKGDQTIDYLVNAKQGQSMNVSLATKHGATYFNILAPHETEVAYFIGNTSGNQFEGTVPASGDQKIRVYMMRSAARRNEQASYRLEIIISGAAAAHQSHDAKVPGTDYHATGPVSCWVGQGGQKSNCDMGVKRRGNGSADVTVTRPGGGQRTIFFEKGTATGYDESQADRQKFRWDRDADRGETIVHIGEEAFVIPDAVIYGG